MTISQLKENLEAMNYGASLDDILNIEALFERVANTVISKLDTIETEREQALSQTVHDDLQNYSLPADYNKIIDLAPQENRNSLDRASRSYIEQFASEIALKNKDITIESKEGTKFIRINWKSKSAKTLHTMDSLTDDGTISAVGSASGLKANELYKLSGSASIEFDLSASGDGLQVSNKTNSLDLDDWDELADFIIPVYFSDVSNFTSATLIWGNDLTANYWTPTAQTTQSDGTAVQAGWNFFLFPWSTATETGTVDPEEIDSFKLTIATSGAITNIRVDNILVSLGKLFDIKYYSKYAFRDSSGVWISKPTTDGDSVVFSGTSLLIYIHECHIAIAQQVRGSDSSISLDESKKALNGDFNAPDSEGRMGLYRRYRMEHPSQAKKQVGSYQSLPKFKR